MVSEETKKILAEGKERRRKHAEEDAQYEADMKRIRDQAAEDEKKGS